MGSENWESVDAEIGGEVDMNETERKSSTTFEPSPLKKPVVSEEEWMPEDEPEVSEEEWVPEDEPEVPEEEWVPED